MTEYLENIRSWDDIYDYLLNQYRRSEAKYAQKEVIKPDVIVPKNRVRDAEKVNAFSRTRRSFHLKSVYNKRHKSYRCSIQVRKYKNGEHLYNGVKEDNNIFLGTSIKEEIKNIDRELYYVQLNWKNPDATPHDDIYQSIRALLGHLFLDVLETNPGDYFKQCCTDEMSF